MTLIYAYQGRGETRDITMLRADGTTITPGSDDKIRATITRLGETAKLTIVSDAPTANGSTFTKNSPESGKNRLRLDAEDLDFEAGVYSLLIDYFDDDDAEEWKNVDRQVFVLEET